MFICRDCGNEFDIPQSSYFEEWDETFSRCPNCHSEDIYDDDDDDEDEYEDEYEDDD